jgi:hypothetical protein
MKNTNVYITLHIPDLVIDFYQYEFNNETRKFDIIAVNKVNVSFVQTSKWHKFYININNKFTGRYLNLISLGEVENYSIRHEIGVAYKNYLENKILDHGHKKDENNIINIPKTELTRIKNLFKYYINPIHKYSSRDELTLLNLM